jgi:hypothetical protein
MIALAGAKPDTGTVKAGASLHRRKQVEIVSFFCAQEIVETGPAKVFGELFMATLIIVNDPHGCQSSHCCSCPENLVTVLEVFTVSCLVVCFLGCRA